MYRENDPFSNLNTGFMGMGGITPPFVMGGMNPMMGMGMGTDFTTPQTVDEFMDKMAQIMQNGVSIRHQYKNPDQKSGNDYNFIGNLGFGTIMPGAVQSAQQAAAFHFWTQKEQLKGVKKQLLIRYKGLSDEDVIFYDSEVLAGILNSGISVNDIANNINNFYGQGMGFDDYDSDPEMMKKSQMLNSLSCMARSVVNTLSQDSMREMPNIVYIRQNVMSVINNITSMGFDVDDIPMKKFEREYNNIKGFFNQISMSIGGMGMGMNMMGGMNPMMFNMPFGSSSDNEKKEDRQKRIKAELSFYARQSGAEIGKQVNRLIRKSFPEMYEGQAEDSEDDYESHRYNDEDDEDTVVRKRKASSKSPRQKKKKLSGNLEELLVENLTDLNTNMKNLSEFVVNKLGGEKEPETTAGAATVRRKKMENSKLKKRDVGEILNDVDDDEIDFDTIEELT